MTRSDPDHATLAVWKDRLAAAPPDPTTRALGALLALGAESRFAELRSLCAAALACGITAADLTEGTLAVHLFGGFPRAIEAFFALSEAGCIVAPLHDRRESTARRAEGERLFESIYGRQSAAVRSQLAAFAPDFESAVIEDAYGRILSRPTLTGVRRELAAVCALAALGLDRQLFSHVRGALALGASAASVESMVMLAAEIAPARREPALATLRRALGRSL